jgi:hypothetical protein
MVFLRGCALALAASLAALCPARAVAETAHRSSSLSWSRLPGAEGCIGSLELARAVENRMGRSLFASPARAELAVEGRAQRRANGYQATLSVARADGTLIGTRELAVDGPDCRLMDEGLIVMLALMIDPDGREPPPAEPPPRQRREAPRAPEPARSPRPGLTSGAFVASGILPSPALGAALAFDVMPFEDWRFEARAGATLPVDTHRAGLARSLRAAFGAVSACPTLLATGAFRGEACGGVELTYLSATDGADGPSATAAAILAGLVATLRLADPLFVVVDATAEVPLERARFTYGALDSTHLDVAERTFFRVAPVTARFGLGLSVHF